MGDKFRFAIDRGGTFTGMSEQRKACYRQRWIVHWYVRDPTCFGLPWTLVAQTLVDPNMLVVL